MTVYVLTLKTWVEYDRPHHTYGRIRWETTTGFESDDSLAPPDATGFCTIRHESRGSAIEGARRWFTKRRRRGDVLLIGVWGLCGWEADEPYEVLEGRLR